MGGVTDLPILFWGTGSQKCMIFYKKIIQMSILHKPWVLLGQFHVSITYPWQCPKTPIHCLDFNISRGRKKDSCIWKKYGNICYHIWSSLTIPLPTQRSWKVSGIGHFFLEITWITHTICLIGVLNLWGQKNAKKWKIFIEIVKFIFFRAIFFNMLNKLGQAYSMDIKQGTEEF